MTKPLYDPIEGIELENRIIDGFGRVYVTPDGSETPSVTTILGSFPKPGLEKWKERVGEQEARRQSKYATDIGTFMHDTLEHWIQGKEHRNPTSIEESIGLKMAETIRDNNWFDLEAVLMIESCLHFDNLYAGRVDMVGIYDGELAIIDYKTSKKFKKYEHLEDYRLQLAMYALAFERLFGERVDTGVNIIATRPNLASGKQPEIQIARINKETMDNHKIMACEKLCEYYLERDPSRLSVIEKALDMI